MNLLMDLVLWLAPIFVVSTGFFLSRVKKMRSQRYFFYAVILFLAFLIDLNSLKFSNYRIDIALFLSVTLVISEFFWGIIGSRNKVFRTISLVSGILVFSYVFRHWFVSGPLHICSLWESKVVSEYSGRNGRYHVREQLGKQGNQDRTFRLYKCLKNIPMEKFIGKFRTPDGYDRAQFNFRWYIKNGAVMVDIIGGSDTLWTLKEDFLE